MKDMKRLFGYMGPYKKDMILGALFVMIETGFELFIPIMISNLIDIGVANHDVNYIYPESVKFILFCNQLSIQNWLSIALIAVFFQFPQ